MNFLSADVGSTAVHDINNAMQIVGDNSGRGFVLDLRNRRLTEIHLPPNFGTGVRFTVTGINNFGQIIGDFFTATEKHGFIANPPYRKTDFQQIDPDSLNGFFPVGGEAGALDAGLRGINDAGYITGNFRRKDETSGGHGLLCLPPYVRKGDCQQIDVPGAGDLTQLQKINNSGQIAGDFNVFDVHGMGIRHGFLATPVGEVINSDDVDISVPGTQQPNDPEKDIVSTTSSTLGCPDGTVGTAFFSRKLRNKTNNKLTNLIVEVTNLNGNSLANADIHRLERIFWTVGSPLGPKEVIIVPFTICLKDLEDFDPRSLVMHVLGTVQ